jgi:hypothetical protein
MRFVSYLVRPFVFLLFGLAAGYYFGYSDAFRDSDTIGSRVSAVIHKVDPAEVRAESARRAATIRDTIHAKAGVVTPEG